MTTDAPEPPHQIVVDAKPAPGDASAGSGSGMAHVVVPVFAAGLLAKYVSLAAALGALAAGVVWFIVRRKPDLGRFALRVEDGVVVVTRERTNVVVARIALADLLDVTLDKQAHNTSGRAGGATAERV